MTICAPGINDPLLLQRARTSHQDAVRMGKAPLHKVFATKCIGAIENLLVTGNPSVQIIYKVRRGMWLDGKAQGYVQVRTSGPLTEKWEQHVLRCRDHGRVNEGDCLAERQMPLQ